MKSESQILSGIFTKEYLNRQTLAWVCSEDAHQHDDHDCVYSSDAVWERLPRTELDFAKSLASFIGTSSLVYVPALDEWRIMDDGVYRALAGDQFLHRCIKRYTSRYQALVNGERTFGDPSGLEGIHEMSKREFGTVALVTEGLSAGTDEFKEFETEYWADYKTNAGRAWVMLASSSLRRDSEPLLTP